MKYIGFVSFVSVFLLSASANLFAADVEEEFRACAAAALETRLSSEPALQVDLSELHRGDFIDTSRTSITKLDLSLTDKESGKELGDVFCILGSDGQVLSSTFTASYDELELALN